MDALGRNLVVIGLLLAAVGAVLWLVGRHGGGLLPGDIVIGRRSVRFYFPVVSCLVVSVVLSLLAWWWRRLGRGRRWRPGFTLPWRRR